MKSYVIRNKKGSIAGFYSWIDQKNLTIFYEEGTNRVNHKFTIDDIHKPEVKLALTRVASLMDNNADDLQQRVDKFLEMLTHYKESLYNEDFCPDLCEIDKWIDTD